MRSHLPHPLLLAAGYAAMLVACAPSTDCQPTSRTVTGVLAEDLVGTWDSFGIDSPVYRQLLADGRMIMVEAPNTFAPEGFRSESTWRVEGERIFFGDQDLGTPTVTATTLVFAGNPDSRTHGRVECRGFGFTDLE